MWVLGDGEVDLSYPPVKTLYDYFHPLGRLIVLDSKEEEESVLAKFLDQSSSRTLCSPFPDGRTETGLGCCSL